MSEDYVDRAFATINGKELDFEDLKITPDKEKKVVRTMNRMGRAKGKSRGCLVYTLAGSTPMIKDSDFDLVKMYEDDEEFPVTVEFGGGKIWNFLDGEFSKVEVDSKDGDATKYSVEIIALDRVDG